LRFHAQDTEVFAMFRDHSRKLFAVCGFVPTLQGWLSRVLTSDSANPRLLTSGEAEPMPRPGAHALLAGHLHR
jgi:hypothetical protein